MKLYFLFKQYNTIDNIIKIITVTIIILPIPVCGKMPFAIVVSFSLLLGCTVSFLFLSSCSFSSVGFDGISVSSKLSQLNFELS